MKTVGGSFVVFAAHRLAGMKVREEDVMKPLVLSG